ncbi:MAG: acyl-CoA/acyl-ACP dehydrogenase [Halieaceae bacterium]|jgi:3-oxocholest-4-en-26-oyl-CoA dehydrogenase beta subunit|nr:acyl-CoA/acyl-ACP dehydrogenase [Halieaceae bacterium]
MDFNYTSEQQILKDLCRKFLEAECGSQCIRDLEKSDSGFSPVLWKKMAELGWPGINIPEQYGGVGLGLVEVAILLEEMGRSAFDSPLFPVVIASTLLDAAGNHSQKMELLSAIAAGDMILSPAIEEPEVSNEPKYISTKAVARGNDYVIDGIKQFVPYADIAGYLLILARSGGAAGSEGGCTLFLVNAGTPGISLTAIETIAPDKQYRLELNEVIVPASCIVGTIHQGLKIVSSVFQKASVLACADMLGGAEYQLQKTADYVKQREQFSRPIGSFQAVQHQMSDMYTMIQGARWTTYQALSLLARDEPCSKEVAIAKAFTSDACQKASAVTHQLHGGVGVDMASDLHFYFRRAKALELKFGSARVQLQRLGDLL